MNNLIYLLFTLSIVFAQTGSISGTVTDTRTKEPLIGVNISIPSLNTGAVTDMNGNYSITDLPYGTYTVIATYVGYAERDLSDIVIRSPKPYTLNISLTESFETGETVVVTAKSLNQKDEIETSKVTLSREEIRRFPGGFEDVVRTVSTLPGVSINVAQGRNDLLVRGGGPSENLYVVNGLEVPNINHFGIQGGGSGNLSIINLDFIENVEFSTGGFGVEYGNKMSSVIDLTLSQGRTDAFSGKALLSATQFGLNLEGPVSTNDSFIFSVRESYLDWIFAANGFAFSPIYTDLNFAYQKTFENNDQLFLLSIWAYDRIGKNNDTEENRIQNSNILNTELRTYINGLTYRMLVDDGYFDFVLNSNIYKFDYFQEDVNLIEYFNSDSYEAEYNAKIINYYKFNKRFGIQTGLTAQYFVNESTTAIGDTIVDRSGNRISRDALGLDERYNRDATSARFGVYTQIDWLPDDQWEIRAGLRYDHIGLINESDYVSPRLNVKFKANDSFHFKASAGRYLQSPSLVWLSNPVNEDLVALENRMAVLGVDYFATNDIRVSAETYLKNYRNLPVGTVPGVNDYVIITNTGTTYSGRNDNFQSFGFYPLQSTATGVSYGLELSVIKKFSDTPFYGQATLSYGKTEFTAADGNTYPGPFDQRIIFNLSGGYKLNEKWEFSGKYRLFTGAPYTPIYRPADNGGQLENVPAEYLSERLETGNQLDLRADRYFFFEKATLTLFLDIQNILNLEIPSRPSYDFVEDEIRQPRAVRILPSIGVNVEF